MYNRDTVRSTNDHYTHTHTPGVVGEVEVVAVDGIGEELGRHAGDPAFDVELAHEPGLHDELGYVVHLNTVVIYR